MIESTGLFGTAQTAQITKDLIFPKLIPISLDQKGGTGPTVRRTVRNIMHVANKGVPKTGSFGYLMRLEQGLMRCWRPIHHPKIWMERGEMDWDVWAKLLEDPVAHPSELFRRVVAIGNDEIGDFEPNIRFVFQVTKRIENGFQARIRDLAIEILCKGFEIHIGCVHVNIEFTTRFRRHIACRYRNTLNPERAASLGGIDGVLRPDDRIVVGKCHTLASEFVGRVCNQFRLRNGAQLGNLSRFRDIPVLAKLAA